MSEGNKLFMVFDVESVGLHGEGFAVGWVVVTGKGEKRGEGYLACDPSLCHGSDSGRSWVRNFVPEMEFTCDISRTMRDTFWNVWLYWKNKGALLVADCSWPVETNFLSQCVRGEHDEREWQGPYPLLDLSSILLAYGQNPIEKTVRRDDELPVHHPLMDARNSARQLVECLSANAIKRRWEIPLWHDSKSVCVPKIVASCPECGEQLVAQCLEHDEETGRPVATGIELDCMNNLRNGEVGHRWCQSDWQPIRDAIVKWCDARQDYGR